MPQITFQADTQDELIEMVRRWVTGLTVGAAPVAAPSAEDREREVREVMRRIRGEDSRNLVLEVAAAASHGAAVPRDAKLLRMFKKTNYTAFAGMVGGANKLMRRIGARHGRTAGEVAIAWTLRNPALTAAIVGMRSPEQVEGVIGALEFRLSPEEIAEIDAARA